MYCRYIGMHQQMFVQHSLVKLLEDNNLIQVRANALYLYHEHNASTFYNFYCTVVSRSNNRLVLAELWVILIITA